MKHNDVHTRPSRAWREHAKPEDCDMPKTERRVLEQITERFLELLQAEQRV